MRHTLSLLGMIVISGAVFAQKPPTATGGATLARSDAPVAEFKKKKTDDWAKQLPDLLPAIQKCVNDAHIPVLFIVKAWPINRGMVGVRLEGPHNRQHDCIATKDGMRLDSVRPVSAHEPPLPQSGNPVFYPAQERPPLIECGRVERVVADRKLFAGWLQYDPCATEIPPLRPGQLRTAKKNYSAEVETTENQSGPHA
ncbi:MAG: hypothetical protein WAQ52_10665 [Terriglobales bacterium]